MWTQLDPLRNGRGSLAPTIAVKPALDEIAACTGSRRVGSPNPFVISLELLTPVALSHDTDEKKLVRGESLSQSLSIPLIAPYDYFLKGSGQDAPPTCGEIGSLSHRIRQRL